jgi:hypothetical protein
MIVQCFSNKNESTTGPENKNFYKLNKALRSQHGLSYVSLLPTHTTTVVYPSFITRQRNYYRVHSFSTEIKTRVHAYDQREARASF